MLTSTRDHRGTHDTLMSEAYSPRREKTEPRVRIKNKDKESLGALPYLDKLRS